LSKGNWSRQIIVTIEPDRARPCHVACQMVNTTQTLSKSTRETEKLEDVLLTPAEFRKRLAKAVDWALEGL